MPAACNVVRRCSYRLHVRLNIGRSSFKPSYVKHACSSTRATNAPAESSAPTARLRPNNSSDAQSTSISTKQNASQTYEDGYPPSPKEGENTLDSYSMSREREVHGLKHTNGPDQLATTAPIIRRVFQRYRDEEQKATRHMGQRTRASEINGTDLETSSEQDKEKYLEHFEDRPNAERHPFSDAEDLKHGALDTEERASLIYSPIVQLSELEKARPEQKSNWIRFRPKQEQIEGEPATGVERPTLAPLSKQLQNVQTEHINTGAVRQQTTQEHFPSMTNEGGDDGLNGAAQPPKKDGLFGQLRNPKGTRTELSTRSSLKSFAKDQESGGEAAVQKGDPRFFKAIRAASVEDIERKLYHTAHHKPDMDGVRFMLKELIKFRHIQPQARHYEALILANCEARGGSAGALYHILAEMEREKIGIGTSTLSAALKVLSIHPDAQLLTNIFQTFSAQWATPSMADTTYMILTFIRLNQFELALTHLEHLISTSPPINNYLQSPIPQYLYATMLYRLSSPAISDHTATLHLLYFLTDNNLAISNTCIFYVLDSAAEALHLDLTLHLWRTHVDTNYIIPSTGLCRNALLTAARNGNAELATKAGRVLEKRGKEFGDVGLRIEELEMVIDAFMEDRGEGPGLEAVKLLYNRMMELRKAEGERDEVKWEMEMDMRWREREMEREREERAKVEKEDGGKDRGETKERARVEGETAYGGRKMR